mmetsp:Transcript_11156/g.24626  ORF Transcript_11156/g.24626 Transcript_11156/m.24626 type:complete len:633 (-) Transcript_11156:25-1923(-)|eukprot:CAMPEP_0206604012 /NCGR_PEP_ID=MMETSP0325_2-20121206/48979_1 /ASSEMBLY_ACC=CAM_ASM_000347 /TAXON_ID=2866 /ORGANISM="Crypthecodinium cohnii, Strain Seligo" /LENGTH=632 /DNA_ID=CAMNT_0054118109 /DNA_START=377 /DNA_END=2275 /DNA_ORIENTATION=+
MISEASNSYYLVGSCGGWSIPYEAMGPTTWQGRTVLETIVTIRDWTLAGSDADSDSVDGNSPRSEHHSKGSADSSPGLERRGADTSGSLLEGDSGVFEAEGCADAPCRFGDVLGEGGGASFVQNTQNFELKPPPAEKTEESGTWAPTLTTSCPDISPSAEGSPSPKRRKHACFEEFQILVGRSWQRRVYPLDVEASASPTSVASSDDAGGFVSLAPGQPTRAGCEVGSGHGCNWIVEGKPGDMFRILFDPARMSVESEFLGNRVVEQTQSRWRGVNLGGWLVLEQWMAPDLFENLVPNSQDEHTLMSKGGDRARQAVTEFRDTFIRFEDLQWLSDVAGINAVRLPVGFWCLPEHAKGTAFLPTMSYVDSVFDWAEETGIQVLLDFHAAIGQQNSEHHSGVAGGRVLWLEGTYRRRNLEVLQAWAKRWGQRKAFLGLGLGNEVGKPKPAEPTWLDSLVCRPCRGIQRNYWEQVVEFYLEAAVLVRPFLKQDAPLVIDTCWDTARFLSGKLCRVPGPIWLDYHHYECFGSEPPRPVETYCKAANLCNQLLIDFPATWPEPAPNFILGEFSLALKPESIGYEDSTWQRRFFRRQTKLAGQRAAGWFFWSYKVAREGWSHWSFRESVELGWIPTPV